MDRERAKQYRDRLAALAARLGGTVRRLEDQVRRPTGGQSDGGLSNTPLHIADVGTEVYTQELDATLLENESFIQGEVAAAIERIDRGVYGRCENCGGDIPEERLDALPYARHCTPCASKLQSGRPVNINDGRPEGWLGTPGHETRDVTELPGLAGTELRSNPDDVHAAGTPGGGAAVGGLAGTNAGRGDPDEEELDEAMGGSAFDAADGPETPKSGEDNPQAFSGPSGGAIGGTPANKRARGGKSPPRKTGKTGKPDPKNKRK
jgi:RNA polymerase-binding transcription factor DksA